MGVVLPDGSIQLGVGDGPTDVAAAMVAVQQAVAPLLDLGQLRIHQTGIKRMRREESNILGADTCYWVHSVWANVGFKGHGRAQFPTTAYVLALLSIYTKIYQRLWENPDGSPRAERPLVAT